MQDITGGKIPFPFWEEAPFHIWGVKRELLPQGSNAHI